MRVYSTKRQSEFTCACHDPSNCSHFRPFRNPRETMDRTGYGTSWTAAAQSGASDADAKTPSSALPVPLIVTMTVPANPNVSTFYRRRTNRLQFNPGATEGAHGDPHGVVSILTIDLGSH
jgi:hypothetical protein